MNDKDYIRAGVELADGWELFEGNPSVHGLLLFNLEPTSPWRQITLDALAAQLVRQVPELYGVWQFPIGVCISSMDIEDARVIARVDGPDRSMNTIKAIVDSKVLK